MRTFTITNGKTKVTIETEETKFDAIDNLILALFRHYRDKKRERLEYLVKLINAASDNLKLLEEWAESRKSKK